MTASQKKIRPKPTKPNLRLLKLRLNHGHSLRRLAYLSGVSVPTLSLAEKGHRPLPSTQFAVAEVYDVQVTDIWPVESQMELIHA